MINLAGPISRQRGQVFRWNIFHIVLMISQLGRISGLWLASEDALKNKPLIHPPANDFLPPCSPVRYF